MLKDSLRAALFSGVLLQAAFSWAGSPDGFVPLLNGSDLSGWEGHPDDWSFADGVLTGVTDGSLRYNRFITWKGGTVRNFELRVQVRITPGGNSGLQYRGTERPDLGDWVVTGYQCDVVPGNPGYDGMLYEERGRRILAQSGQKVVIDPDGQPWSVGALPMKEFPANEWHDYRVRVEGNHHRHWIDGHPTVDVVDLDAHGRTLEGVIAVQVHVGPAMKVEYRDFLLKRLPDDLPLLAAADHPIPPDATWVRPQRRLPKGWTPPVRGERWIDLRDHFRRAKRPAAPTAQNGAQVSGGRELPALFLHAAAPGQPPSEIVFPAIRFPEVGDGIAGIALRTAIGFKDGEAFVDAKSDGCHFVVLANGEEVYRRDYAAQDWLPESVDLTACAGQEVVLTLRTEPKQTSAADWACFATPALWLTGEKDAIRRQLEVSEAFESPWPFDQLSKDRATPQRTFLHTENLHIAVMDEHLDLATALARSGQTAPVPLAPGIVVGEGAHPDNHTLIRILGGHGIATAQFLAFPPDVRGGVRVEAVGSVIAATPLAKGAPPVIALFDRNGTPLRRIRPPLAAPFALASVGDELAVCSAAGGEILFYAVDGSEIRRLPGRPGRTTLAAQGEMLLVYGETGRILTVIRPATGERSERTLGTLPPGRSVFASAFDPAHLWACGPQSTHSHVYEILPDGRHIGRDIGTEENLFWLALPKEWEQDFGPFKGKAAAKHIRFADYGHIRVDSLSPRYRDPAAGDWAGDAFLAALKQRGLTKPLDRQPPRMWNPTFTHRMFPSAFRAWAEQTDPATGLHLWLQQSPTGGMDGYGRWDQPGFVTSTYAPGATAMQQLYTEPLRAFLRMWSPLYRQQPWLAPSIEPNHEFEAVVATDGGIGDYNPFMIAGFYDWLVRHYGADRAAWKEKIGLPVGEYFDAPRGLARGRWDRYAADNPYLIAWEDFNRYVISRTLALTYREALAAGVPPEMIRCHQIPDSYAVAPILRDGISRITPIDYAMTAGVGFGFTKFGVNYDKPANIVRSAKTSGFDSFVMGEFQPLTTDAETAAKELRYVFENGARAIHPLYWGAQHTGGAADPDDRRKNETVYAAIQALVDEDPPRPGQAGGVGEIRAFRDGDRAFNIVSIGAGKDQRGLLKSIRADGRMEGTVYVVPFHQHVNVEPLDAGDGTIRLPGSIAPGSQIEVLARAASGAAIRVFRGETELADLATSLRGNFRYTLRLPSRIDGLMLRVEGDGVTDISATLQSPEAADVHVGRNEGRPHVGGVTFDILAP